MTYIEGMFADDELQCDTQAWSAGCIVDLYDDASKYSAELLGEAQH